MFQLCFFSNVPRFLPFLQLLSSLSENEQCFSLHLLTRRTSSFYKSSIIDVARTSCSSSSICCSSSS